MKLWNNYKKEMKIASRGFYFYVEIIVAVIVLAVLLMVVPAESQHKIKEVCFCDMTSSQFEELINLREGKGYHEKAEDEEFKLKPAVLKYTDENGREITKEYKDKKKIKVKQYFYHDSITGKHTKTKYFTDNFDDMLRLAYDKKYVATEMWYGEDGKDNYHNVLFGYETEKYKNILKVAHGTIDIVKIQEQMEVEKDNTITLSEKKTLNNRENFIPAILLMFAGVLGVLVIIAYISVDKSEGVLKAICTTPLSTGSYLMSKILVSMTTVIFSCAIITIPVMGKGPDYLLLFITVLAMTFLSCTIGTFISTFFEDVESSFGAILLLGILLMIPMISYMVPAFNPDWLRYMPSYYMLESIRESLLGGSISYVIIISLCMVTGGILLLFLSERRYKKTLGM